MVQLILSHHRGNAGGRYFPYQGYLGLTPVRVDGVVCTRLEEDGKPILAKSLAVAVRCYESRQGKRGVTHSRLVVDYGSVLWRKPDDQEYAELGHHDATFKITLPKRVGGFSTAHYQEYRTFWRVEAVIEHIPIGGVGTRLLRYFDLPLIRYDVPPPPTPLSPASPFPAFHSPTPHVLCLPNAKSPTPVLHYNISTPELPIGPSDLIFTSIHLRPLDSSITIRSASVFIERRIELHQTHSSNANPSTSLYPSTPDVLPDDSNPSPRDGHFHSAMPSSSTSPPMAQSNSAPEASSSRRPRPSHLSPPTQRIHTFDVPSPTESTASSSSYSASSVTPLIPRSPSPSNTQSYPSPPPITPLTDVPAKTLTSTITYADSGVGGFAYDASTGVWSKTVSIQWPKSKSQHVWAMGETVKSELAAVSFWVKVKIIVTSPSFGTVTLDLEPREITVVSTNDADRRLALSKFAEMRDKSRDRERESAKSPASTTTTTSSEKQSMESRLSSPLPKGSRKSRHHEDSHHPCPDSGPQLHAHSTPSPSSTSLHPPPSRKSSRRPHTSAGPRDKSNLPYTSPPEPMPPSSKRSSGIGNGQTRSGGSVRPQTGMSVNEVQVPRSSISSSHNGATRDVTTNVVEVGGSKQDAIRAWEEELSRIEKQSRRSTADMLAFFGLAKRRRKDREGDKDGKKRAAKGTRAGVW